MTWCSAVIAGGREDRVAEWSESIAGSSFQRGRPLVLISHCTALVSILAVVCMLF